MKKIVPLIILFICFVGLAFYATYNNAKTNIDFKETWQLGSTSNQQIEIYGTEQPVELKVIETSNDETTVTVSGKISKTSMAAVKDTELSESKLYIPISKHGFRLYTTGSGKETLTITVEVGKDVEDYEIFLDTISGRVNVVVPNDFQGKYDVELSAGAKLIKVPDTLETSNNKIKIDAYSDVEITKGE